MKTREVAGTMGASLAILALGAALLLTPGCSKQPKKLANGEAPAPVSGKPTMEVASVNGDPITLQDISRVIATWKSGRVPGVDPNQPEGVLQQKAVDELIGQKLLYAEAVKAGKAPSDSTMQGALRQAKSGFPSEAAFDSALTKQGLTQAALIQGFKVDAAIRSYIQSSIQDTVKVTPEQAKAYYGSHSDQFQHPEQVRLAHISAQVPPMATPDSVELRHRKMLAAYKELHKGDDFQEVSREFSSPASGISGGEMGFVNKGQLPPPLDSLAFVLPVGQYSEPVRSSWGFHIIKVEEKRAAGTSAYDEVQSRLMQMIYGQRINDKIESIITDDKTKAKIKRKI